jgi:pimeloyl-ACP methyl ester carboxylesterase
MPSTELATGAVPLVTIFPGEIYRAPRSWAARCYHQLAYWNEVDKGGHFAAFEQPDLFAQEVRSAFATHRGRSS